MKRIVYVEDNEDNVFMLRTRLELEDGFHVLVAPDGVKGLSLIREVRPDLVLMDLDLPAIDGWELTRRLKSDPSTAEIPVIALTAHAMAGDRERALAAGCDEFDSKPVNLERLLGKMNALLGTSV